MSQVLLPTKLFIPRLKSQLVSRPRLLRRLDFIRKRKLALVSAPAGFGKTTLLVEWLTQQVEVDPSFVSTWLSLDSHDNDPYRFIIYLVSALQRVKPDLGCEVMTMVEADQTIPVEGIWEYLISDISSIPFPFIIVLDDYHIIENHQIHKCLAFLLEQMPPSMHMIISSRADPPLQLSRLRGRDELVELRGLDLRFNSEEVTDFIAQWTGRNLPYDDQSELEARIEGWIAGLQLAAIAMQSLLQNEGQDTQVRSMSNFIHRLSGNSRFILDYLAEEVLAAQTETVRNFLLKTSILERFTAPLCDVLTDSQDSRYILEILEKHNLFLFPLDDERNWYRYHHLFADVLRSTLQHQYPSVLPELHRKASTWYESQGWIDEAIQYALKIPDQSEAARLMEKAVIEVLLHGDVNTIQKWSTWIGEEEARQRPFLCVCFALAFIVSDKLDLVEHFLSLPDPSISTPGLQGPFLAANSLLSWCKGDYEDAIHYGRQAVEQLLPDQTYLKGLLALSSGFGFEAIGEDEAAFESFQEAKLMSRAIGNRTCELSALKKMGHLQIRRGQLHQADLYFHQALKLGSIGGGKLLPVMAQTIASMGQLLYEWNQIEEAEQYLLQGVELARKLGNPYDLLLNVQNLARVHWVQEKRESAFRLQHETEQILLEFPPIPSYAAQAAIQQIRMYLQSGETQTAIRWAQLYCKDWKSGQAYSEELMTILWIRIWIAQENAPRAINTLEQALHQARSAGRWGVVIELLVLQSLALVIAGQVPQARDSLEEALRLAETEGYIRIFLDEGEPMAQLLRLVYRSKDKGSRNYETRLLERLIPAEAKKQPSSPGPHAGRSVDHPVLIDPLTERELEALHMIVDGFSNQEIAEKMVITLGTVKAHVSNIYRKLDVRSRTQAMNKADQLGLL